MTNPQNNQDVDPLASFDKVPAVSFTTDNGFPQNTWQTFEVTDYIKLVQSKDDNGKPEVYEDSGKPVMKGALAVINEDGEARTIWAKRNNVEGGLFRALREAQSSLGEGKRIGPGVKLAIRWHNDTTKPKKLGNHPKAYEVTAQAGPAPAPKEDALAAPVAAPVASDEPPF